MDTSNTPPPAHNGTNGDPDAPEGVRNKTGRTTAIVVTGAVAAAGLAQPVEVAWHNGQTPRDARGEITYDLAAAVTPDGAQAAVGARVPADPALNQKILQSIVAWARSKIGKINETQGANRSPQIAALSKGAVNGEPWCALFATDGVHEGYAANGLESPITGGHTYGVSKLPEWSLPYTLDNISGIMGIQKWGKVNHRWVSRLAAKKDPSWQPTPGYLVIYDENGGVGKKAGHVGIVDNGSNRLRLKTVEGNTSNAVKDHSYVQYLDNPIVLGFVDTGLDGAGVPATQPAPTTPAPAAPVKPSHPSGQPKAKTGNTSDVPTLLGGGALADPPRQTSPAQGSGSDTPTVLGPGASAIDAAPPSVGSQTDTPTVLAASVTPLSDSEWRRYTDPRTDTVVNRPSQADSPTVMGSGTPARGRTPTSARQAPSQPAAASAEGDRLRALIPASTRRLFEQDAPKRGSRLWALYDKVASHHDLPTELLLAIHGREGGFNPHNSSFEGERLGTAGSTSGRVFHTLEDSLNATAVHVNEMSHAVYGFRLHRTGNTFAELAEALLAYNRGAMYKRAGKSYNTSPYVMDGIDHRHMNMRWNSGSAEPPSVRGNVDGDRLGGMASYLLAGGAVKA